MFSTVRLNLNYPFYIKGIYQYKTTAKGKSLAVKFCSVVNKAIHLKTTYLYVYRHSRGNVNDIIFTVQTFTLLSEISKGKFANIFLY